MAIFNGTNINVEVEFEIGAVCYFGSFDVDFNRDGEFYANTFTGYTTDEDGECRCEIHVWKTSEVAILEHVARNQIANAVCDAHFEGRAA